MTESAGMVGEFGNVAAHQKTTVPRPVKTDHVEMEGICRYAFSVVHEPPKGGNEWQINSGWRRLKPFAKAARGHWGMENPMGRVLDETFDEDRSRERQQSASRTVFPDFPASSSAF